MNQQTRQMEIMLLGAADLSSLLEILLVSMPRHFGCQTAELWLYDPEDVLSGLLGGSQRYGEHLRMLSDAFDMQELYDLEPDVVLVDATDPRMFEVLKSDHGIDYAMLLPLTDSGRMIGSLHFGMRDPVLYQGEAEEDLVAHMAAVISLCFKNMVMRQQVSQLTLLDPLTQISNIRGFEKDIAREISRARRAEQPLSVLMMEIDEYEDLYLHYGKITSHFVMKKVAERIYSDLRATDYMARLSDSTLAVLLPSCSESRGYDIGTRMAGDIDDFAVDDGRGAVLYVTLSVGLVTWDPQQYPAVDMPQLAKQIQTEAQRSLGSAKTDGGNRVARGRLSTMML
jgi:diguanylate cyclase (GGDEF)-like protein